MCHLLADSSHLELWAARRGRLLPVSLAVLGKELAGSVVGGGDDRARGEAQGVAELVVEDAAAVAHLGEVEAQRLQLQFIARHVVLQRHTLRMAVLDVADELGGEVDVALQHLLAVGRLLQFKILSQRYQPPVLP